MPSRPGIPGGEAGVNGGRGRRHPLLLVSSAGRRAHGRPPSADRAASSATPNTRCDVDSHATAAGDSRHGGRWMPSAGRSRAVGARVDRETGECAPCPGSPRASGSRRRYTPHRDRRPCRSGSRCWARSRCGTVSRRPSATVARSTRTAGGMFSGCPLGSAPTSCFWLGEGGRIASASRLQARLGKRLDPRRHKTGDHTFRWHERNVGGHRRALKHDRLSAGNEPRSAASGRRRGGANPDADDRDSRSRVS